MNIFFNKHLSLSILSIVLLSFLTVSCNKHEHAEHEHGEHHEHAEHDEHGEHHDHDAHDDEHSSLFATIIKDGKTVALEIKGHKDALFDKAKNESEVSLENFSKQTQESVVFPTNDCEVSKAKTSIEEEGHHKIYVVSFSAQCQANIMKVQFSYGKKFSPIKRIHANVMINNVVHEHTVQADGVLSLD